MYHGHQTGMHDLSGVITVCIARCRMNHTVGAEMATFSRLFQGSQPFWQVATDGTELVLAESPGSRGGRQGETSKRKRWERRRVEGLRVWVYTGPQEQRSRGRHNWKACVTRRVEELPTSVVRRHKALLLPRSYGHAAARAAIKAGACRAIALPRSSLSTCSPATSPLLAVFRTSST